MRWINSWQEAPAGKPSGRGGRGGAGRTVLAAVAVGMFSACGARVPGVELQTGACSGTPVLEGVATLRWRVTGEGMAPVERSVPVDLGVAGMPAVPPGKGRVLEVRGYGPLPGLGGAPLALGRSRPFDVPASGDGAPPVPLTLRRVGEFTRAWTGPDCRGLTRARAGHTATLLEDGRVLLVGGFGKNENGTTVVSEAEIFDPEKGSVERAPGLDSARFFHTATRLPGGRVLLVGGAGKPAGGKLFPALASARVLEVATGTATEATGLRARIQHAAAVDADGRVLIVGGVNDEEQVISQAEGYDAATGRFFPVDTPVPRAGMSLLPLGDGRRLVVAGGSDGTRLVPEVLYFSFQGNTFVPESPGELLLEPRRDGALVPFGGAGRLLYVGGSTAPGAATLDSLVASSQVLSPEASARQGHGLQVFARSQLCAVALPDGRVLTLGGYGASEGLLQSSTRGELFVPGPEAGTASLFGLPALPQSRRLHTCTVLEDGAVLLAGGSADDGFQDTPLDDLLVYMPVPLD